MTVPYTFANASSPIPLDELDANFAAVGDSSNIEYLPSGSGAVATTVQAKLRQTVSVKDFGAIGDGTTDDTTAIQDTIDYLEANGGGVVFIPAGTYKITSSISITWPNVTDQSSNGRVTIQGEGSGITIISDYRSSTGNINADSSLIIDFSGHTDAHLTAGSNWFLAAIGGFAINRGANSGTGNGIYCQKVAFLEMTDVRCENYYNGYLMRNVLSSTFTSCFSYNNANNGFDFSIDTSTGSSVGRSDPNSICIRDSSIAFCSNYALSVQRGANFSVDNCQIESNGSMTNPSSAGIIYQGNPQEGDNGLTVYNTYFENNAGAADIYFGHSDTWGLKVVNNVIGCNFNRISSTTYTYNNIVFNTWSGTDTVVGNIIGCGFQGFNTYVPSAGTKYINVVGTHSGTCFFGNYIGNTYASNTEAPTDTLYQYNNSGSGSYNLISSGGYVGVSSFNTRTGAITLTSSDVTTALGYTPPSSAVSSFNTRTGAVTLTSGDVTTALGYTPLNGVPTLDQVVTAGSNSTLNASFGNNPSYPAIIGSSATGPLGDTAAVATSGSSFATAISGSVATYLYSSGGSSYFVPGTNNSIDLGNSTYKWKSLTVNGAFNWNGYAITAPGGATTTFLRNDGTWATPAGSGNVSNVGTPTNGQIGQWTGSTTIQGVNANAIAFTTGTLSLAGNVTTTGAYSLGLTTTAATSITLPTSGTVVSSVTALPGAVTGTPSSSTYLRGDGTWSSVTPTTPTLDQVAAAGSNSTYNLSIGNNGSYQTIVGSSASGPLGNTAAIATTSSSIGMAITSSLAAYLYKSGSNTYFVPSTTATIDLGNSTYTWRNLNISGNFTWGSYGISAPGGSSTTFLRNDGTWAAPATPTLNQVTTSGATTTDNVRFGPSVTWSTAPQVIVNNTTTSHTALGVVTSGSTSYCSIYTTSSTGSPFFGFTYGTPSSFTVVGSITTDGTNTTYGTSSDRRLKSNIESLAAGAGLEKIKALQPRTFTWNSTNEQGTGFIADELKAVVSAAVAGEADAVNEDGSVRPQSVDTSFLIVYLVQAIQELSAQVEELRGKINV